MLHRAPRLRPKKRRYRKDRNSGPNFQKAGTESGKTIKLKIDRIEHRKMNAENKREKREAVERERRTA